MRQWQTSCAPWDILIEEAAAVTSVASSDTTCDIIIAVWNLPDITRHCLDCVERYTDVPYRLILIDNGSDLPTRRIIEEVRKRCPQTTTVLRNEENRGYVIAVNQGLAVSSATYVCLLNNDVFVTPGWLSGIIQAAESDLMIGLVNCELKDCRSAFPRAETHERVPSYPPNNLLDLDHTTGSCLLIKRAVLDRIGGLDEGYGMGHWEDNDFSRRAEEAGFRAVRFLGISVWDYVSASFPILPGWQIGARSNMERYYTRWGRPEIILVPILPAVSKTPGEFARIMLVCRTMAEAHHRVILVTGDLDEVAVLSWFRRLGIRPHQNIQTRRVGSAFPGYRWRLEGWLYWMRRRSLRKGLRPWVWMEDPELRKRLIDRRWFHRLDVVSNPEERIPLTKRMDAVKSV